MRAVFRFAVDSLNFQFPRFLLVGGFGFAIDVGVFFVLNHLIDLVPARIIAFLVAVTATWGLNRLFTFRSKDPHYKSEWLRYTVVNAIGGSINFFGFFGLVHHVQFFHAYPSIALTLMSALAAFINYFVSKQFAFYNQHTV